MGQIARDPNTEPERGHVRSIAVKWLSAPAQLVSVRRAARFAARYRYLALLHHRTRGRSPILVFTLGKVGSTSILRLLENELDRPIIHCHQIAPLGAPRGPATSTSAARTGPSDWRGDYARHLLRSAGQDSQWDIVCGVRDPMARLVSAFFQVGELGGVSDVDAASRVSLITDLIERRVLAGGGQLDWFETQLEAVTSINVMDQPFDRTAGYQIFVANRFRVLLFRFEDLRRIGPDALNEFLGVTIFDQIPHENLAESKAYADLYRTFKSTAQFSPEVIDHIYGSRLARHFYSANEILKMRRAWTTRS